MLTLLIIFLSIFGATLSILSSLENFDKLTFKKYEIYHYSFMMAMGSLVIVFFIGLFSTPKVKKHVDVYNIIPYEDGDYIKKGNCGNIKCYVFLYDKGKKIKIMSSFDFANVEVVKDGVEKLQYQKIFYTFDDHWINDISLGMQKKYQTTHKLLVPKNEKIKINNER